MTSIKLVELIQRAQKAIDLANLEAIRCKNEKAIAALAVARANIGESIKS